MKSIKGISLLLTGLLLTGLAVTVWGMEQSACITCHLDEAKLIKNLSKAVAKTSAMQSGSG